MGHVFVISSSIQPHKDHQDGSVGRSDRQDIRRPLQPKNSHETESSNTYGRSDKTCITLLDEHHDPHGTKQHGRSDSAHERPVHQFMERRLVPRIAYRPTLIPRL